MSDHAQTSRSAPQHRAQADTVDLPPTFTASCLAGVVVAGGWLLDSLGLLSAPASVGASITAGAGVLWWAAARARAARRGLPAQLQKVRTERDAAHQALRTVYDTAVGGRQSVRWAAEQAERGTVPTDFKPSESVKLTGDLCHDAVALTRMAGEESWQTVLTVAADQQRMLNERAELAEIFKAIAPRLQSLVNRIIEAITEAQQSVEDPELLADWYRVDQLATQTRRFAESLAILAGRTPPRDLEPVLLASVLRRAAQEIPKFERVRVQRSPHAAAALPGYVSPSVVHVLAALMENATHFSDARVEVLLHRTEEGIVVEVTDRGLGMSQPKRDALNRLLDAPEREDLRGHLREGRLGLLVAALLAAHKQDPREGGVQSGGRHPRLRPPARSAPHPGRDAPTAPGRRAWLWHTGRTRAPAAAPARCVGHR